MIHFLLQDSAFWYAVSFFLFIVIAAPKGLKITKDALQAHRSTIEKDFKEAEALYQSALLEKKAMSQQLHLWPQQEKKKKEQHLQEIINIKKSFEEKIALFETQKTLVTEKYLASKQQESQSRLEREVASHIVQDLKKLL